MRGAVAAIVVALGFGVVTVFHSLIAIPFALLWPDAGIPVIARRWAKAVLAVAGVRVELVSEVPLPERGAFVVMANHTSHFDVVSLYASLPLAVRMVAKRELTYIPIFGWALALGGAIIIDRGNRERAIASIARAGRVLRRGSSVVLFPEGTRTAPGLLGPLKKGPFHLASETKLPILPIGIRGTGEILAVGDWRIHPGTIALRAGEPIQTDDVADDDAGREVLRVRVEAALTQLGALEREGRESA